jgi:hypothetical protein
LSAFIFLYFAFCFYCTTHKNTNIHTPAGFEPAIPGSDRQQTLRIEGLATDMEFDPRTVQPVGSPYTDSAIPAHPFSIITHYNFAVRFNIVTPSTLRVRSHRHFVIISSPDINIFGKE